MKNLQRGHCVWRFYVSLLRHDSVPSSAYYASPERTVLRRLRIVAWFAAVGFFISFALLGYSYLFFSRNHFPNYRVTLFIYPPSIFSLALDDASTMVGLLGLLIIALMNAAVYGGLGFLVALVLPNLD
jgi:hypothetical protein